MNKYKLTFLNPELESNYQKFNKPFMFEKFYDFFKIQLLYVLSMLIIGFTKESFSITRVLALICFFLFVFFFFVLKKYIKKIFFDFFMITFCSVIGIFFVERIKSHSLNEAIDISDVILALGFQFYLNIILLTRIRWIYCGALYSFNIVYLLSRFMSSKYQYTAETLLGSTILVLNFTILSYRHEKTFREFFKTLQDSNDNLKKFKEIMQGILPSPIIIINYQGNILDFCNKSAEKLLRKILKVDSLTEKKLLFLQKIETTTLKDFEEMMDSFTVLKQDSHSFIEEKPIMSVLMKKFFQKKLAFNEFDTIHICKGIGDQIIDKNNQGFFSKNRHYEVKLCQIEWKNNTCLLMIFNNQTKAKRLIELMNLDKYKNQMLATVSHDLRTPLNGIIGMMTTVLPVLVDKASKKNLQIGIRSAYLLNYLINDILDFSQISYKKLRIQKEKINIFELVSEIFILMKFQAKKKLLNFKKEFLINEWEYFYSDPTRIKQILLNLLGNAIKFTNEGGSIILRVETKGEHVAKFSVIDTGIGIKAEDQPKLFVLFGKLKQENSEINRAGIGFGLTISQNLAKMLYSGPDSGILLNSEFGKGSVFSFKIDFKKEFLEDFSSIDEKSPIYANNCIGMNKKENDSIGSASIDKSYFLKKNEQIDSFFELSPSLKLNMLIVDDDAMNVMILEQYLEFFKFKYRSVMDGLEAVKFIEREVIEKNNEISAILMDCNMPIMDGFRASEIINDMLKKNNKNIIPIIAITANVTNEDIELCFKSGMKKYLAKPVRRRDLGEMFQQMFNIRVNGIGN